MKWQFDENTPIYLQIIEQIKTMIATGQLREGDKLPSVRELAVEAGVNPNTMQRALSALEREGLLYSVRTSGRFVAQIEEQSSKLQNELALQYIDEFLNSMKGLGYTAEEAAALLKEHVGEK